MQDTQAAVQSPKAARAFFGSFPPDAGGLSREQVAELRSVLDEDRMRQGLIGSDGRSRTRSPLRTGKTQWITSEEVGPAFFSHLYTLAVVANRELDWNFSVAGPGRSLQATSYSGEGSEGEHYDWHMDWGAGRLRHRKITVVAQLSDPVEYEGGQLQLTIGSQPVEAPRGLGNVTVFPSFLLHRVTPVTRGRRLGVVSWMLGDPFA